MNTPLLDGIQKQALLDILIPGGYGYYARGKGNNLSDTALRGALIGGGVEGVSSIGDILSGNVDLNTFTSPVKGAIVGGVSSIGGYTLLPLLLKGSRNVDWSKAGKKAIEKAKKILDGLGDASRSAG